VASAVQRWHAFTFMLPQ